MHKKAPPPEGIGKIVDEFRSYFYLPTPQEQQKLRRLAAAIDRYRALQKSGHTPRVQGGLIVNLTVNQWLVRILYAKAY